MRTMWLVLVISIPAYLYAGKLVQGISWLKFQDAGKTFVALAALELLAFSWVLGKRFIPARRSLRSQPGSADAVKRWMSSWTILLCNAHSVIIFGFAFWMGDKTLRQSLPFFVIGSVLMISLWPR